MPRPKNGYCNAAGEPVPGVHDITGRYKEMGGLMNWAHSQGRKGLPLYQSDVLNTGTVVHRMAELDLRGAPEREIERVPHEMLEAPADLDKVFQAFRQFRQWRKEHDIRAIAFEESLVSEVHQYGGTNDNVALIDGARGLFDLKTCKTAGEVYLDQRIVMAAHGNLWREHHPDLPLTGGYHLITLPKDGSKFGHHAFADLSPEWEMFTLQLDCWRIEKGIMRKRTAKPATIATAAPEATEAVSAPAKPRRTRKPKTTPPAAPAFTAPPIAPLSMGELLRAYGHVREAA